MAEYCNILQLILLCFLAYNSVFATGNEFRCIEKERQALLEFKKGLIDDYGFFSSWGSEEHERECCQWKGIECSHHSVHVIALQLSSCEHQYSMRLRGEKISSALIELKYLTHLDLSCNDFGKFPDFIGSMEKLQYLNFHNCGFFGGVIRHQLANLTNLRTLDLGNNYDLEFENLHWLSHLSSLSLLDLSENNLRDVNSLNDILNIPSLKELSLRGCRFPRHLSVNSSSTSLSILHLSVTRLTSSSFHWLFNISSSLRSLDMSYNDLESNIPSEFGKFAFLKHLDLSWNQPTGGIPKSFGNLSLLHTLDLSYNQLTGGIPKSLGNLSHFQSLFLSRNSLSESLSELFHKLYVGAKQSLEILDLEENYLYGSVPDFTLFPSLRILRLQNNQLNGHFPRAFSHISKLEILDLSSNQIKGSVPDLSPLVSLTYLHFSGNKLASLPTSLGQLSMLEILDVSFNLLERTITEIHLSELHNLKQLDLSFSQLGFNVSVDWIPPFQLEVIKLATCHIGPRFPTWLRTQTNSTWLDLSHNGISDEVPKWFWDFSPKMDYLNLPITRLWVAFLISLP